MTKTKIEWTDRVWNPVTGCTPIASGCGRCYAKRMANRLRGRCGYPKDDPFRVTAHRDRLRQPLRWRKQSRVFVCSMGDLFHSDINGDFIEAVFGAMAQASHHQFQILTKRPERMRAWIVGQDHQSCVARYINYTELRHPKLTKYQKPGWPWPLPNVWLGVSVSNQEEANEKIPLLLQTLAVKRFVSLEPLLGPVDLTKLKDDEIGANWNVLEMLDWAIAGGETGPGARPMHPDWARSVRDQCVAAGVPFFFKQWGEWAPADSIEATSTAHHGWWEEDPRDGGVPRVDWPMESRRPIRETSYRVGKKAAGNQLDGRTWEEMPCA